MRILVTIVSIGFLLILVLSNMSPPMAITFLSRQTIELPLGIWLLGAVIIGFLSSLAVRALFNLQQRRLLTRLRQLERELDRSAAPEFNFRSTNPALGDDWGDAPSQGAAEEDEDIYPENEYLEEEEDNYIEPDSRGEVVDAGFRVIRPPETDEPPLRYTPPPTDRSTSRDGEDWGFDFDEDGDESDRSSPRRQR